MTTRTVTTEAERALLVQFIQNHKLPFTATVETGKRRSVEQNKLQRLWCREVSEQTGDTPEEVRAYCKLHFGVPILREENDAYREKYDQYIKPMDYAAKLAIMAEPIDFPVTRLMTAAQKTRYLDAIAKHFAEQGILLTQPEAA